MSNPPELKQTEQKTEDKSPREPEVREDTGKAQTTQLEEHSHTHRPVRDVDSPLQMFGDVQN